MPAGTFRLLLVPGSTRATSTTTAALRTLARLAPDGVEAVLWDGLTQVPAFVPDDDGDGYPAVRDLRRLVAAADVVLFCSPEYAGTFPGSLKNALDWLVGSGEFYGRQVAVLDSAPDGRGAGVATSLRAVLDYLGTVQLPVDLAAAVTRADVTADGSVTKGPARDALAAALTRLLDAAPAVNPLCGESGS